MSDIESIMQEQSVPLTAKQAHRALTSRAECAAMKQPPEIVCAALPDYPAAHSMDTEWFAVDRDGHVAIFSTGEAGAVPKSASQEGDVSLLIELAELRPACGVLKDPSGHLPPVAGRQHVDPLPASAPPADPPASSFLVRLGLFFNGSRKSVSAQPSDANREAFISFPMLMFLRSRRLVEREIAAGEGEVLPSTAYVAVHFPRLSFETHRRLHESGECLGCFYHFEEAPHADAASAGVFRYDHEFGENWIAAPYGRTECPLEPLRIEDVPTRLRPQIESVGFSDLCFAETPFLQPVDKVDCFAWEGAYLSGDWKTIRAVPGQEDQYRESYENHLSEMEGDFVVEPPKEDSEWQ
ncbi:MAG: hypothetical protein ACOY3P_18675 [Planctomycetota bacterium]